VNVVLFTLDFEVSHGNHEQLTVRGMNMEFCVPERIFVDQPSTSTDDK
jgi:hypothetical protein